jgi:hypothetical protein
MRPGPPTAFSPARGWAPKGDRLISAVPHGHWHTTTFVCGLRTTGLVAPLVPDGAINGATFLAYIEQFLVPTLRLQCTRRAGRRAAMDTAGR